MCEDCFDHEKAELPVPNKDVITRWIDALRSGEYHQGRAVLARFTTSEQDGAIPIRYCCLGVLCELAVQDRIIDPAAHSEDSKSLRYDGQGAVVSTAVQAWAGITEDGEFVDDPYLDIRQALTSLNDDEGYTFSEIADEIELKILPYAK
jgi:hypothetical protein